MSQELLRVAQTAISLGARLIPPLKSKVALHFYARSNNRPGVVYAYLTDSRYSDQHSKTMVTTKTYLDSAGEAYWYLLPSMALYPVELPADCPPIETWERYD